MKQVTFSLFAFENSSVSLELEICMLQLETGLSQTSADSNIKGMIAFV